MVELMAADPETFNGEAPRRGRGRPRGSTNAPRDPNAPRRGRKPGKRDLTTEIADLLKLGNLALFGGELVPGMVLNGAIPAALVLQGDPLTTEEIEVLAKAINGVAQQQVLVYRYLNMILTGTGTGNPYVMLAIVCAAIAIPRIVAHSNGAVPPLAATLAVGAGQYFAGMRPSVAAVAG